ncbi:hypothetical protein RHGRI_021607 [Rhododendron griersonianum]|uniref:Chaperone DnaJ C-terminal domain-containing protein n=1 Tax=Rhododendron griersonianum TaxID=479676 RepID=A0AAV6JML6_9ERIC|nr:hypothetical protein RHGRI_021607 [Rhododendron griersonianum]
MKLLLPHWSSFPDPAVTGVVSVESTSFREELAALPGRVHEERAAARHQRGGSPVSGGQLRRISGMDDSQLRRCCERGVDELPGGIGCAAGRVHEERAAAGHRRGGSPMSGGQLRRIFGVDGDRLRRNSTGSVPIWAGLRFLSEETIQEYGLGYPLNAKARICPACDGIGKEYCRACRGSGVAEGVKEVKATIPAGVETGDTIRVPKAGNAGRRGTQPGSLHIKLKA